MPRPGYIGNDILRHEVERSDSRVRPMIEAVVTSREDRVNTFDEWVQRTPIEGIPLEDGGIRIAGSIVDLFDHSGGPADDPTDGNHTTLESPRKVPLGGTILAHEIEWGGSNPQSIEIHSVEARLEARLTDTVPQNVATWVCQLFRISSKDSEQAGELITLHPIAGAVSVKPTGPDVEDVVFDFVGLSGAIPTVGPTPQGRTKPVTVVVIWGLKADGTTATNIGLRREPTSSPIVDNNHTMTTYRYRVPSNNALEVGPTVWDRDSVEDQSRLKLTTGSYSVAEFSVELDLGGTPTGVVEFRARYDAPLDSSVVTRVRNDADTAWVPYVDGQTTDDLAGVGKRATYEIQVTLTPGTSVGPTIREVAVQELTRWNMDAVASFSMDGYRIDPVTHVGRIPSARVTIERNGVRDYRDLGTRLLSENFLKTIEIEVYAGHPEIPRENWLLHDRWIVLDADLGPENITLILTSPLDLCVRKIPDFDSSVGRRTPLQVSNRTTKQAYGDVMNAIGLDGKYRGPGVEGTSIVSRRIEEARGKTELDSLAFIDDYAVTSFGGLVRAVKMEASGGVYEFFPAEDITLESIPLGARARVEEVFVPYNYVEAENEFASELRAFDAIAISTVGQSYVDSFERIKDDTAEWIRDLPTAQALAERVLRRLGSGLMVWRFHAGTRSPARAVGDTVAIEIDRFAASDPYTSTPTPLRGRLAAIGVLVEVNDFWGQGLAIWVQGFKDIQPATQPVTRVGFATPALYDVRLQQADTRAKVSWVPNVAVHDIIILQIVLDLPRPDDEDDFELLENEEGVTVNRAVTEHFFDRPGQTDQIKLIEIIPRDANGNQGPSWRSIIPPNTVDVLAPTVVPEPTEASGVGTLNLNILNIELVNEVSFKVKSSPGVFAVTMPPDGTWVRDTTAPFNLTATAPIQPKHNTLIAYAVGFVNSSGSQDYLTGIVTFDSGHVAQIESMSARFDADGSVMVSGNGDSDLVQGLVTVAVGSAPPDPTLASNNGTWSGISGEVDTGLVPDTGATIFYKVRGVNSLGELGPVASASLTRGIGEDLIEMWIPATSFRPTTDVGDYDIGDGNLSTRSAATTTYAAGITFPANVRVIMAHFDWGLDGAGDSFSGALYRLTSTGKVAVASQGSVSGPSDGTSIIVPSFVEDAVPGRAYSYEVTLTASGAGTARMESAMIRYMVDPA